MKKYFLKGLDCPSCAAKLEKGLQKELNNNDISVNFTTKTISLPDKSLNQAKKITKKIEPDIEIIEIDNKTYERVSIFNSDFYRLLIALIIFFIALFFSNAPIKTMLYITAYFISGYKTLIKTYKNFLNRDFFDENFLIFVATFGAFAINQFAEAVAVILFYNIGEFLQDVAVNRSKRSIQKLMELKPQKTTVIRNNKEIETQPEKVNPDEIIVVKPGERVSLDGIVVEGEGLINTATITGESKPIKMKKGDKILSGSISENGYFKIKVISKFENSLIAKIIKLVEEASEKKSKIEQFITKFSRIYTPIVVYTAIIIAFIFPIILQQPFEKWIYRALILLVISCPCALVISIPLTYFAGIGKSAKHHILFKGSNYLEELNSIDIVMFDKTGTLTKGEFNVQKIVPANGFSEQALKEVICIAEGKSNHPIAQAIIKSLKCDEKHIDTSFTEIKGMGIVVHSDEKRVIVGNEKLLRKFNISHKKLCKNDTVVHVGIDDKYAGCILLGDSVKNTSKQTIQNLQKLGIKTIILTGDNEESAKKIGEKLGVDEIYSSLLPDEKMKILENIKNKNGQKVAFVGDGINDAPVIAASDIGIAMGVKGSDIAIETADVIIMNDEPIAVSDAISIAKKTKKTAIENIVFSLSVKIGFIILGILGIANMWEAVFADVGVTLIAVANSLKIFRYNVEQGA